MRPLGDICYNKLFFTAPQALRPPCLKGKRSAVAEVNDSGSCQSRDRIARRRLSAE